MVQYGTVTNHGDHTFGILGHSIPMFYHGNCLPDLPLRRLHYINLEYTYGELPVAYTLCSKKVKVLSLSIGEAKSIPVYASCNVTIPPGSQVIHNTGLLLALLAGTHGEIFGTPYASRLEPWVAPGILMPSEKEVLILLANMSCEAMAVSKGNSAHVDTKNFNSGHVNTFNVNTIVK
ncbi:hypothetical protein DSO57_1032750 [Entomophthora muscae]|uniref:Uncharacterized protein n=1 Tax=Entomophthora muscae TaxID=34485 RepID=A0ACC2TYV0_9FUNG|nr:hypothetical protein DSO57_1032750 [Entomophthora muscae]